MVVGSLSSVQNQISILPSVRPLPIEVLCGSPFGVMPLLFAPEDWNEAVKLVPGDEKPGVSVMPPAKFRSMLATLPL